jgi:hypothetical protein
MANVQFDYEALDALIVDSKVNTKNLRVMYPFILQSTGSIELTLAIADRVKQVEFYKGFCADLN